MLQRVDAELSKTEFEGGGRKTFNVTMPCATVYLNDKK
jgi:hypothetical protein